MNFKTFVKKYGPEAGEIGPLLFANEVFGINLDPWQEEVLRAYGRCEPGISIKACHGPGKTFIASICIWHQLLCRFPQNTVATAPSIGQLEDALVKEVEIRYYEMPPDLKRLFGSKKNYFYLKSAPKNCWFRAKTARAEKPEALQGVHCDLGWVLLVGDEASGIPEQIYESAEGSMSGHRVTTLLLGNPLRGSGYFYDTFNRLKDDWFTRTVSHEDSPRVTDEFVDRIRKRYGENSNQFRVRCLGEFPLTDQDTVLSWDIVRSAIDRDIHIPKSSRIKTVWAVDVARFGDDATSLIKRSNFHVFGLRSWVGADLMTTCGRIYHAYTQEKEEHRPGVILIDSIGVGAGVVDRLRELGLPVRGVNVSEVSSLDEETYANLRAELWFRARNWLSEKTKKLPKCDGRCPSRLDCIHERLAEELTCVKYDYTSNGKLLVESKAQLKKRGIKSPNLAEAFILSFAEDPTSVLSAHGSWHYRFNPQMNKSFTHKPQDKYTDPRVTEHAGGYGPETMEPIQHRTLRHLGNIV